MTLVLSLATPAYGLQVSDRLVSRGRRPVDPLANKTVVLRGTDGLITLSYCGPAVTRGIPTDSWIATQVAGREVVSDAVLSFGGLRVRDLGSTLRSLRDKANDWPEFIARGGEIVGVGFQWKEKHERLWLRHVLWRLRGRSGVAELTQVVPRSYLDRIDKYRVAGSGRVHLSGDEWDELVKKLGESGRDWKRAEELMVDAVRLASSREPNAVGPHCMSVRVAPQGQPNVEIQFKPERVHVAMIEGSRVPVAYGPWLIDPGSAIAPSVSVGGMTGTGGPTSWVIRAPAVPDSQPLKGAMRAQERPLL